MKKNYFLAGKIILVLFTFGLLSSMALADKVFFDKEGKQYAKTENDCKMANFAPLNKELASKGFAAGPDGGYVKTSSSYYCNPCVKYTGKNKPKNFKEISALYKPIEPIVYKYAKGASYEYCTIKGLK